MAKFIQYEFTNHSENYDVFGILLALAQNGNACNVQKEIGVRMVYAAMMDNCFEHMRAESLETRLLTILRQSREAYAERTAEVAIKECALGMNSHYIIPFRNRFAAKIGLSLIPDPDDCTRHITKSFDLETVFWGMYSVDSILQIVRIAANETPRKLDYHLLLEYLQTLKPADVEEYEFNQNFVFDMETGKFTDAALICMLCKLGIFQAQDEQAVEIEENTA